MKRRWVRVVLGAIGLLALWFPLTWFFFGSVHPCGILNYRMARRNSQYALYEFLSTARRNLELIKRNIPIELPEDVDSRVAAMERRAYTLAPAACLWRAITWRWDPAKDRIFQSLRDKADG